MRVPDGQQVAQRAAADVDRRPGARTISRSGRALPGQAEEREHVGLAARRSPKAAWKRPICSAASPAGRGQEEDPRARAAGELEDEVVERGVAARRGEAPAAEGEDVRSRAVMRRRPAPARRRPRQLAVERLLDHGPVLVRDDAIRAPRRAARSRRAAGPRPRSAGRRRPRRRSPRASRRRRSGGTPCGARARRRSARSWSGAAGPGPSHALGGPWKAVTASANQHSEPALRPHSTCRAARPRRRTASRPCARQVPSRLTARCRPRRR